MNNGKAHISELAGRDELHEVGRFRYRVYVNEMARFQRYANHQCETIIEPLDEASTILVARAAKRIVGTLRISFCSKTDVGVYIEKYGMSQFSPHFPTRCTITTKLMVDPEFRCSTLPMQLMCFGFRLECANANLFDFIDCNSHLGPMFTRYGYRQVVPDYLDNEYGSVTPLVLVCGDQEHLNHCRSPFRKDCPDTPQARDSAKWFNEKFAATLGGRTAPQKLVPEADGVNIFEGMEFPDQIR